MERMDISVLIVEDEDIIRLQIREILKKNVENIYEARNGEEGLIVFQKNHPDIVITDITMPRMNGLDMIENLRESYKSFLCIIMSSHNDGEHLMRAINLDVDGYMIKPVDEKKLLKKIRQCFDEKKLRDEENARKASNIFLSNISHELKTPLIGILGFSEMLLAMEEDHEKKELIDIIFRSGKKLSSVIDDILDFAKISDGIIELNRDKFRIEELLETINGRFAKYADEKGLKMNFLINNRGTELIGDFNKLNHLIGHVVSNAIKFSEKGSIEVESSNLTNDKNPLLEIVIRDTGIGMSRTAVKEMFKPFHQGEKYMTKKYGGTGLGMAIVKNLIEYYNGYIDVDSEIDKGTIVTIGLPTNRK